MSEATEFDVCGPLPTGVTVLEASAGTGKTFTIAALAARYVADGVPLDELLMVTFTRMATGELRERVRERLVSAEQGLSRALAGAVPEDDDVVRLLATGSAEEVELRRERLARALAGFDSATIATTHGFCQEVLGGLGVVGDVEPDTTFLEDISDLRQEVVDDLYVRRWHRHGQPQFGMGQAMEIARAAIDNPDAPIEPAAAPADTVEAMRVRLASAARDELDARKRRMAVMTYDDLLTRLQETLSGPDGGAAAAMLRARYSVVLVDEFQDTDPVQWEIMRTAFGGGDVTLVLIGDPKQAIYAFRGADVYAYIEAARTAGDRATLRTNWRSDQGLLDAYDALFGEAKLGHEGIVYRQVRSAPGGRAAPLEGVADPAPLRVRVVPRDAAGVTPKGYARLESAREHVARDVAADIVGLLDSSAPLSPGDVAVLVRTNKNAARVRDALEAVDVPAVINGAGSVFGTEPAREWLRLLEAIERPAYPPRARSAALTLFLGWTTEEVAGADDDAWEAVHRRLHHWARVLRAKGVASLIEAITLEEGLPGRVLSLADGERRLTDLRHVAELLHAAATAEQMGATALTAWLRERVLEAAQDNSDEERSRRLESDAQAVQVLTVHRSKGLEFPVVYYPDLWEPSPAPRRDRPAPVVFHDDDGRRTIDVGLDGPQWGDHVARHTDEQRGEDLRLAYVALTRAKHQAVVWWAGSWDSRDAALTRLLFSRDEAGNVASAGSAVPTDDAAFARFEELRAAAPGCVSVAWSRVEEVGAWAGSALGGAALSASSFDRELDWWWRRTSYSDLTAGTWEARVASEPEEPVVEDEAAAPTLFAVAEPGDELRAIPSLLDGMPVGTEVGTLVHRVFETVDFAADDLGGEIALHVEAAQARRRVELGDVSAVVAGLQAAIETPLGPAMGGARLRDVARADRLDELVFELPLVGGDHPAGPALTLRAIGDVLRGSLPAGDPLSGYADRLLDPGLRESVRGYLTGSIDLVVRLGDGRFAIADYKTNWLAPRGETLTAWHHRPAALTVEMHHGHYGLQALLYVVALHRYLRWRLPGYSADRHLAGVLYLFVRGMSGPDTPVVDGMPCGVFTWQPPAALVEALSDVLDRGEATA
ncbi:MAG: Exodeoxyribonuclease V beta chain [uncultured Solirubrobacteraceae bacterium]|uniref:RecBCD enzyme subunit RecB n=1 Tax=uncultured Solirubrobacteraceae bacterium TaxID=1162706 RepID=A0A6J4REV7_9ACTN|nr:MAG: Exodeoxyribonuclease V beta chain [uncultured Solirubrobacteraceae bacterium]